jgi:hypothetical protein
LIDLHYLIQSRSRFKAWQSTQNVLQLFTLGVEDVAQAELLSSNGGNDLIDAALSAQRRLDWGKGWQ